MVYYAQLVADYFLTHTNKPLTAMHMIKLIYITHGFTLAITKESLIRTRIEAWKYGPVIPVLYHSYKGYGGSTIDKLDYCGTPLTDEKINDRKICLESVFDDQTYDILDQILDIYGSHSALELSALTHEKGTQWHQCYKPNHLFTLIPDNIIQEYYEEKMTNVQTGN